MEETLYTRAAANNERMREATSRYEEQRHNAMYEYMLQPIGRLGAQVAQGAKDWGTTFSSAIDIANSLNPMHRRAR